MNGDDLRKLRTSNKVTQSELAKYLGYLSNGEPNRSMIARLENNHAKINPRIEKLINIFFKDMNYDRKI